MGLLILGLALWWGGHLFKRVAPARRAAMGDKGKGLVAAVLLVSVVLMVLGYRSADAVQIWTPPAFLTHLNNLLMLLAFYLYAASASKVWIATKIRHPQLAAVKTWAVAHLLVNGDSASILLFGGLLAWAVVSVIVINRSEPAWVPPRQAPMKKEITTPIIAVAVMGAVMGIHLWLGVPPFG